MLWSKSQAVNIQKIIVLYAEILKNHQMKLHIITAVLFSAWLFASCNKSAENLAEQWQEIDITFESETEYKNPYTDIDLWVEFTHTSGDKVRRPAFWYGDDFWKVRFASPHAEGKWTWKTDCSNPDDRGLNGKKGRLKASAYTGNNPLTEHGLLRMSPGGRNVVHADGTPFLLIADTPWALPWRGTVESVTTYAENRRERGFNAALLMSLQPDQDARGPDDRTAAGGFGKAFHDLPEGHINRMNPEYFILMDSLMNILVDHGIVPVYQPVFHGFGWKGLRVLGNEVDTSEYVRYQQYLLARYGAKPAFWLVSGDNNGYDPGVKEAGEFLQVNDTYGQPTGIHYNPMDDHQPEWAPEWKCFHYNRAHQAEEWLDFQWCQTGHNGEHLLHKVERMYENKPTKAVANGEPTYEGIRDPANGSGWWQGHEAWMQFTSGGTMGVVYGAGGLWNWKLFAEEEGWDDWCNSLVSWREAIELPGARHVGYLGRALDGLDITDIEKHPELAGGAFCLAKPGKLYIIYLPGGGDVEVDGLSGEAKFRWFDPKSGGYVEEGLTNNFTFQAPVMPAVLVIEGEK